MKFWTSAAAAMLALGLAPATARAGVVIDNLPPAGAAYFGNYVNSAGATNFLARFTLAEATDITGFDILTVASDARLGEAVRVKIRADVGGRPATANLYSFTDAIDAVSVFDIDSRIAATDFAAIRLAAGSYWFGVSSDSGRSIGWNSYNTDGFVFRTDQRVLDGDAIVAANTGIHELSWRIRSDAVAPGAVPEPATWAMMITGFGAVGATLRRRSARVVFAA